jgi:hypothetical protein
LLNFEKIIKKITKKNFWIDIVYLNCSNDKITNLDNLPHNLQELYCFGNGITNLDNLPNSLKYLNGEKYLNIFDSYLNTTNDI